jgi:hypothetical protein
MHAIHQMFAFAARPLKSLPSGIRQINRRKVKSIADTQR